MRNKVLQRLVSERTSVLEAIDQVLQAPEDDERDPSQSELDLVGRNKTRVDELNTQINALLEVEESRTASAEVRETLLRAAPPKPGEGDADGGGGGGEYVYRTFAEYARDALITRVDRVAAMVGPDLRSHAAERLQRAVINTLSSDVPGLIPPQHITQIFDVINKARPIVEASRRVNLTSGKLQYPSITGRPLVGKQSAEKTEVTGHKMQVAMLEVVADTFLGSGDLSWQTINWGTPDALALFFDLAAESYAEQTEKEVAADLVAGATATAIPVATNDLPGWLSAIAAAAAAIRKRKGGRPNTIATDIDTGYRLLSLVSTANPVFIAAGSGNLGEGTGNAAGLRLVISDQLAAGSAIVGDFSKLLVAETAGAPVEMRAVEPNIGGLEVGVIGAFADALVLPGAFQKLTPPA